MDRHVPVRKLNQQTSAILKEVAAGVAVTVTSDGRPVARLVPLTGSSTSLDRLVAMGRARAPSVTAPLRMPPEYDSDAPDVAAALAADRDRERW